MKKSKSPWFSKKLTASVKSNPLQDLSDEIANQILSSASLKALAIKCLEKGQVLMWSSFDDDLYFGSWLNRDLQDLKENTPTLYARCKEYKKELPQDLIVAYPVQVQNWSVQYVVIAYKKDLISQ